MWIGPNTKRDEDDLGQKSSSQNQTRNVTVTWCASLTTGAPGHPKNVKGFGTFDPNVIGNYDHAVCSLV